MFSSTFISSTVIALAVIAGVRAESHTVSFSNNCGHGTPTLRSQSGAVLSTGSAFTINGPLIGAIAYLQTGPCGANGENCVLVETTLKNPTTPGSGSSTDLSLIPPHAFQITTGFRYTNGCSGSADCTGPNCPQAFHNPGQTGVQVPCQVNNVDLVITFCE
ncbi:glycopeptide [Peniophora sp. CONT]|nr:glycopeptide [Peniophora sp. CONT]